MPLVFVCKKSTSVIEKHHSYIPQIITKLKKSIKGLFIKSLSVYDILTNDSIISYTDRYQENLNYFTSDALINLSLFVFVY